MSEAESCGGPKVGNFSWNELITPDPKAAEAFYRQLFGWQSRPFSPPGTPAGAPPYTVFLTDANTMGVGGMMASPAPGMPAQWHAYVIVKNVDESVALATKLGGKVCLSGHGCARGGPSSDGSGSAGGHDRLAPAAGLRFRSRFSLRH